MIPCLHIIPIKALCGIILTSESLYWMYKYNVLLILKTMLNEGRKYLQNPTNGNHLKISTISDILDELKKNPKILDNVCKCLKSEDEVKILACECIEEMVENFIQVDSDDEGENDGKENNKDKESLGHWSYQGTNYNELLEQVLKDSDDIECTAISVFNLLIRIAKHEKFDKNKFIDLSTTLPFNFHKMLQVRLSFTLMMKQITRLEFEQYQTSRKLKFLTVELLQKLFLMGIQV